MKLLDGSVALVTGAGSGLGRSHAIHLAGLGATVIVHDGDAAAVTATIELIEKQGAKPVALVGDIADWSGTIAQIRDVETRLGGVDILINSAALYETKAIEDITPELFDAMFAVYVNGGFAAAQAVVPGMKRRRRGRIINTSSIAAMVGDETSSHHAGATAALLGLTKAWAQELAPWNILVNSVAPGNPLPARSSDGSQIGYADPMEISSVVAFLVSPMADFITGQTVSPNGGAAIVGI